MHSHTLQLLVLVTSLLHSDCGRSGPKGRGRVIRRMGPNTCNLEYVKKLNLTFPKIWTHGYFCGHQTVLRKQCCEGYSTAALEHGCPVVGVRGTVMSHASSMYPGSRYIKLSSLYHLEDYLRREMKGHAFTLLMTPDNNPEDSKGESSRKFSKRDKSEAVLRLRDKYSPNPSEKKPITPFQSPASKRIKNFMDFMKYTELRKFKMKVQDDLVEITTEKMVMPNFLLRSIIKGSIYAKDFKLKETITSLDQDSTIQVTKLSKEMVLFNCVPPSRLNIPATDGVMHVLSRALPFVEKGSNLARLIASQPKLTLFRTLLAYADELEGLRSEGEKLTVLAVTDDAMTQVPSHYLDSITYDTKYRPALRGYRCSLVFQSRSFVKTIDGSKLPLDCTPDSRPSVAEGKVLEADLIATNGVLHIVDKLLLPPKSQSLVQATRRSGALQFLKLFDADLISQLVAYGPYTIFAPSDRVLQKESVKIAEFKSDAQSLRCCLLDHIVLGSHSSNSMIDHTVLTPLSAIDTKLINLQKDYCQQKLRNGRIVLRNLQEKLTASDASVVSSNHAAFNGYVHVIDKVLTHQSQTLADALLGYKNITRFMGLVDKAPWSIWSRLSSSGSDQWTVVLVADSDMERWSEDTFTYYRIREDDYLLQQLMVAHILPGLWLPHSLTEDLHYEITPQELPDREVPDDYRHLADYAPLRLSKTRGLMSLSHTSIHPFYRLCANGVIYFGDGLLVPR